MNSRSATLTVDQIRLEESADLRCASDANDLRRMHARLSEFIATDCPACGVDTAEPSFEKYRCRVVECGRRVAVLHVPAADTGGHGRLPLPLGELRDLAGQDFPRIRGVAPGPDLPARHRSPDRALPARGPGAPVAGRDRPGLRRVPRTRVAQRLFRRSLGLQAQFVDGRDLPQQGGKGLRVLAGEARRPPRGDGGLRGLLRDDRTGVPVGPIPRLAGPAVAARRPAHADSSERSGLRYRDARYRIAIDRYRTREPLQPTPHSGAARALRIHRCAVSDVGSLLPRFMVGAGL